MNKRKWIGFIAKLFFTACVLVFILKQVSIVEYKNAFSLIRLKSIVFLLATTFPLISFLAFRWSYLAMLTTSIKIPYLSAAEGVLISFFFSQGLPASIGGDVFRVWWLKKRGMPSNSGLSIAVIDRIFGLFALIIACLISVLLYCTIWGHFNNDLKEFFALFFVIVLMMSLGGYSLFGFVKLLTKHSSRLPPWSRGITNSFLQIGHVLKKCKGPQNFILIGTSLLTHSISILQAFIIMQALRPNDENLIICFLAVPPALFISYLPISIAGWGVREAAMVIALGHFGVSSSVSIMVSLIIGMTMFLISLFGGGLWGFRLVGNLRMRDRVSTK